MNYNGEARYDDKHDSFHYRGQPELFQSGKRSK